MLELEEEEEEEGCETLSSGLVTIALVKREQLELLAKYLRKVKPVNIPM